MAFAYLSDGERERLRQLPFPVALPQELPPGWQAQPLIVFEDPDEEGEVSVEAPFTGPQSARLIVMTSNGGMGDALPLDTSETLESPAFGAILVHSGTEDGIPELHSDWFPEEEEAAFYHSFRGANVSSGDLQTLVTKLDLLESP